ncbi:flagellar assembly protein FliW [Brevibacillus panacihumi W25]|uniref:Flagellar assembly factor FliW n=1 Tax=Brevibacillus panacihumi W25 TaxID=1408254 RepID=V6MAW2_9BACL|nr:flagellar assembly protein FliW [Brevibacillus panacihumi]EST55407.1 flagellar assembly protein FliW [Brevibacillus panacihumi W25]
MSGTQNISIGKLFFEEGLPGFPDMQFFNISKEEANAPFYQMNSTEDETIGFWLIDPFVFFPEYQFVLPEYAKASLRLEDQNPSVAVLNIITLREEGQITINLKAPIVINRENRMAKQVILNEESYSLRHPLFQ